MKKSFVVGTLSAVVLALGSMSAIAENINSTDIQQATPENRTEGVESAEVTFTAAGIDMAQDGDIIGDEVKDIVVGSR